MKYLALILVIMLAFVGAYTYTTPIANAPVTDDMPADAGDDTISPSMPPKPMAGHVDLSDRGLVVFPTNILSLTATKSIDISGNMLTGALPAEIRFLSSLEALDASDNAMTGLPAEIGQLSRLRILDLSDNDLTGLPHELGNLQSLEILDLSGNAVSQTDLDIIRSRLPATTRIVL